MISLIHPSKGRPQQAYDTAKEWLKKAGGVEVQHLLSVDFSDKELNGYRKLFAMPIINHNDSVVEATNKVAKYATGDILIYLSDDFKCPDNWAGLVQKEFEGENRPLLLKVDDCLQPFNVAVLTIPMMNRQLYEKLGYFWHPGYKSMFCDEDLYWTVKKIGAMKLAPHLKFEHCHVSVGKAKDDETYRNSAKNWDQGKALFRRRKDEGFL